MLVAVGTWELQLPGCRSLKEKRSVLKPLTNRLANLNVSVAETGYQDRRHMAEIACAAVASDRTVAESTIRAVDSLIETTDGVRILDTATVYR
jgi:uncharacterized protein YlxP (DUF503 family)